MQAQVTINQSINHSDFCRSGRSLTLVTQYDVELFQKIEALTGHKMEEYPAEQEAVLLLLERVGEAQRISTMQVPAPPIGSSYWPLPLAPPISSSYKPLPLASPVSDSY